MDHWMVLDQRSAAGRPQLWVPDDKLADGWYNLRVRPTVTVVHTMPLLSYHVIFWQPTETVALHTSTAVHGWLAGWPF
jgi:hypothetical protein